MELAGRQIHRLAGLQAHQIQKVDGEQADIMVAARGEGLIGSEHPVFRLILGKRPLSVLPCQTIHQGAQQPIRFFRAILHRHDALIERPQQALAPFGILADRG